MRFFLGTHEPSWLGQVDLPLFVSVRRLRTRRPGGRALQPWAIDSGGFTELLRGERGRARWRTPLAQYVEEVHRAVETVGNVLWAAPQDWMCEPQMIDGGRLPGGLVAAGTGLSVREHQERTVQSLLDLRSAGPGLPFVPVLQGWTLEEYMACVDLYAEAGIDLAAEPVVGVGSVCRRQGTREAATLARELCGAGIALHFFGAKTDGIPVYGEFLASADSMAWSLNARLHPPLPECVRARAAWEAAGRPRCRPGMRPHPGRCGNCWRWAKRWTANIAGKGRQLQLV